MKKTIMGICLVGMLTVGLATGCSKEVPQKEANTEDTDVLRVGMDLKFPPFSDIDKNGEPIGLEPTIAEAFAKSIGKDVEIVNTDFSMLLPALEVGDVDILIADMSETPERAEKADFSIPYRYSHQLALVNRAYAEANQITDEMAEEDFFALPDNQFIGLAGTMGVFVPQKWNVPVKEVTEIGTGIMEVLNGTATSLVASNEVHAFHAANKENTVVYGGITSYTGSSFVVRKGDAKLLEEANAFIASMYDPEGLYDQIRDEYDGVVGAFLQNDDLGLDYIVNPPIKE